MKKYFILILLTGVAEFGRGQEIFELRDEVHKYLSQSNSNFNFAMIAEAYRNETGVAFFWPCIIDSVLVDDKILAVAFEKQNGEWESVDMFIASKDTGMTNFLRVIGGKDYRLVKPNGLPLENLGNFMLDKIKNAHGALRKKENAKAINEIEEFSRVFGLSSCAFSNTMAEYIMKGVKVVDISDIKFSNVVTKNNSGNATLDVYFPKQAKSQKVKLIKVGTGWAMEYLN